jgi:segregation and condensation protein B
MTLDAQIEAILFFRGDPMDISKIALVLGRTESEIEEGLVLLQSKLEGRGINLSRHDNKVMLGTVSESFDIINSVIKEDLVRDLGKAGLETLTTVLYRGPITRAGIDHVRGVNSSFILRNLLIRGLIEKYPNPQDSRSFLYKASFDLISYLGLTSVEELPEYTETKQKIVEFESRDILSAEDDNDTHTTE